MNKTLEGNFLVVLTEGDIIPASGIAPCPDGIKITSGETSTTVFTEMLAGIYPLQETGKLSDLYRQAISKDDKSALTNTLCGVLELTQLIKIFQEEQKKNNPSLPPSRLRLTLFGSASLALTLLPQRVSHDIDVTAPVRFAEFCQKMRPRSRGAELELLPPRLLQYLGEWESRAGILDTGNAIIHLIHPLDTVMQKLLRTDKARFNHNDKKDISATLEKLNPPRETLLFLLTENPSRFRRAIDKEIVEAIKRNTTWFLDTFIGKMTYKELVSEANAQERDMLETYGMISTKPSGIQPIPDRKLEDYIRPILPT